MEFIIDDPKKKHLLILVHGLNGSRETWIGDQYRLVENLQQEQLIQSHFNLALYAYPTKIFRFNLLAKIINTIGGFLKNRPVEDVKGFNVGIQALSRPFETSLRNAAPNYDSITIVAHSMGGLVTKSALRWLSDDTDALKKVKLFFSLSVPHIGAALAKVGTDILGDNPQIVDLKAMGAFTTDLNDAYYNLLYLPRTFYQSGFTDTVVTRASGIPAAMPRAFTLSTGDNHFSIVKIKDRRNNEVYNTLLKELGLLFQAFTSVNVDVPAGVGFKSFVDLMAQKLEFFVTYIGFTNDELDTQLTAGDITATSSYEFLNKIRALLPKGFPAYEIEQNPYNAKFILKKI